MANKEYLNVAQLSKESGMTTRHVRTIIKELSQSKSNDLIRKDKHNKWEVHHLLKSKFKRKRKSKQKYFALSFQTYSGYTPSEIKTILKSVFDRIDDVNLELHYTIEMKKSNNKPHVHSYVATTKKRELFQTLKLLFANLSYHESKIFDLTRWKGYMTKDGHSITTLKRN
ncbi:hypothetical protein [Mangrovimonas sp. DI 80]|uniref:hypothetical protein n=1 Tax=Mangrovimonas sp. DI 80 TaxID=1779330 RepID=UPI0009771933|nr:hypothetical protein [Mangrovimonas sp. DI 80]OMP30647.1 hypothetical protein BKM32_10420 [Mangrovimonas sp. DI 80]